MAYGAKVVLDSVNPAGSRLITLELDYARFIHSELLTYRALSRNASGSRAIPVEKVVERIERDPAMPVYWAKNQKGMQATEELDEKGVALAKAVWLHARDGAVSAATALRDLGLHKALANRLVEPWAHIQVVVTATDWENFFMQRCHPAAQAEMQALAEAMLAAVKASRPARLAWGDWHLPYLEPWERIADTAIERKVRWSVARCARVSYMKHGASRIDYADDERLHGLLMESRHYSPFEHVAEAVYAASAAEVGNFGAGCHWRQYRKTLPGERVFAQNPRADEIREALRVK